MKTIIKMLILTVILISCQKDYPKPGTYQTTFTGKYEVDGALFSEISYTTITETTKDYFYIGSSKIYKCKCGKKIRGRMGSTSGLAWSEIEGVYQKKKGKYYLTGTYRASDYSARIINGEFEMKSN
jgi:hypothetical protein